MMHRNGGGDIWHSTALRWRHNERDGVSNHQPHDCFQPFMQTQIKENIKAPGPCPCEGNSPVTSEFPAQMASNAENVSIWWRHHGPLRLHPREHNTAANNAIYLLPLNMRNIITDNALWALRRPKSPTTQLIVQQLVQADIKILRTTFSDRFIRR